MEPRFSRRQALQLGVLGAAGTAAIAGAPSSPAYGQQAQAQPTKTPQPSIKPRSAWATNHPVKGTLQAEEDVRFLLIHHSASRNDYSADETAKQIQSFYHFHTGEKAWPDIAYNFFVDRFGTIWEAREGSLKGAIRGDATGGSQGHAMLCCFIGNHQEAPIAAEAKNSMIQLLAWLADTYAVKTDPGATVAFTSRGSNKWEQGQSVTARTISAHREMSLTSCPGDFAFDTIRNELPGAVTKVRNSYASAPSTTLPSPSSSVEGDTTSIASATSAATSVSQTTIDTALTAPDTTTAATTSDSSLLTEKSQNTVTKNSESGSNMGLYSAVLLASGGAAAAIAAALVIRKKRTDGQ